LILDLQTGENSKKSETAAVKNLWSRDHMPFQVSSSADHHGRG